MKVTVDPGLRGVKNTTIFQTFFLRRKVGKLSHCRNPFKEIWKFMTMNQAIWQKWDSQARNIGYLKQQDR